MPREYRKTLTLTRRADGRYCKKIGGVIRYFSRDRKEAEQQLLDLYRLLGITDQGKQPDNIVAKDVAYAYAAYCRARINEGTMKNGTFDDYDKAMAVFLSHIGPNTRVSAIRADQFASFKRQLAKKLGTWALDRNIQAIRTMFKWAYENAMIEEIPRYGSKFKKSTPSERGYEQAEKRKTSGYRKFEPDELRQILLHPKCKGDLRTFVLLGLNAGFYSIDCSELLWEEIRDEGDVLVVERMRSKTSRKQMFPCWPEAARDILAKGRKKSGRIFETIHGNAWNRDGTDAISGEFQKLRRAAGVGRDGLGFGAFRHTHVSAVSALGDQNAAKLVRGHQIQGIDRHYDFPSLERLKIITDHARLNLLVRNIPAETAWLVRT